MLDVSTAVAIVLVPKEVSALGTPRRELSEDVRIVRYFGTLLVVEQIELGKPPQGGVVM